MLPKKHKLIQKPKKAQGKAECDSEDEKLKDQPYLEQQVPQDMMQPIAIQSKEEQQIQLPPMKFMEIPLKEVATMPVEEREKLRNQYPKLAEYIFMSQREKTKFFHQKNLSYRKTMQTPGNLPARKIQFKRKFQVKFFNEQESPTAIKAKKVHKEKYDSKIHKN